jgi:hypothetical protein
MDEPGDPAAGDRSLRVMTKNGLLLPGSARAETGSPGNQPARVPCRSQAGNRMGAVARSPCPQQACVRLDASQSPEVPAAPSTSERKARVATQR